MHGRFIWYQCGVTKSRLRHSVNHAGRDVITSVTRSTATRGTASFFTVVNSVEWAGSNYVTRGNATMLPKLLPTARIERRFTGG